MIFDRKELADEIKRRTGADKVAAFQPVSTQAVYPGRDPASFDRMAVHWRPRPRMVGPAVALHRLRSRVGGRQD